MFEMGLLVASEASAGNESWRVWHLVYQKPDDAPFGSFYASKDKKGGRDKFWKINLYNFRTDVVTVRLLRSGEVKKIGESRVVERRDGTIKLKLNGTYQNEALYKLYEMATNFGL